MQKKLLITVSDEVSHLYGVRFVCSFFRNKSAVSATLFYTAPHADLAGTGAAMKPIEKKAARARERKARQALDTARRKLCDRGFPEQNITSKFIFRQFGTVKDIIREARAGNYDAVVLGRRGYLVFESLLSTSVSRQIVDQDLDFPIWICRRPQEDYGNVLLCVDGSAAGLRMADHVGFMIEDESGHSVTLFHVEAGEGESKEAVMSMMSEARRLLGDRVPDSRIESVVVSSPATGVAKRIIEEAAAKNYAAVAVGRVGIRKGRLKEWLVGSRTMKLLDSIEKSALWVSS